MTDTIEDLNKLQEASAALKANIFNDGGNHSEWATLDFSNLPNDDAGRQVLRHFVNVHIIPNIVIESRTYEAKSKDADAMGTAPADNGFDAPVKRSKTAPGGDVSNGSSSSSSSSTTNTVHEYYYVDAAENGPRKRIRVKSAPLQVAFDPKDYGEKETYQEKLARAAAHGGGDVKMYRSVVLRRCNFKGSETFTDPRNGKQPYVDWEQRSEAYEHAAHYFDEKMLELATEHYRSMLDPNLLVKRIPVANVSFERVHAIYDPLARYDVTASTVMLDTKDRSRTVKPEDVRRGVVCELLLTPTRYAVNSTKTTMSNKSNILALNFVEEPIKFSAHAAMSPEEAKMEYADMFVSAAASSSTAQHGAGGIINNSGTENAEMPEIPPHTHVAA